MRWVTLNYEPCTSSRCIKKFKGRFYQATAQVLSNVFAVPVFMCSTCGGQLYYAGFEKERNNP